ncbi:MAG: ABC transporter permease [Acidimicrobiales bacterium]|nr:ABC transporter permease [Acidimicrobiales bacterium]
MVAVPLAALAQQAHWSTFFDDITSPAALDALRLSVLGALAASAIAVVFGTPLAWVLARGHVPFRAVVRGIVLLPMVVPPVVGGVALLSAFSLRSPIGGFLHDTFGIQFTFSMAGVVLAQTFVAMPFYVITVEAALRNADHTLEEEAVTLGAGPWVVFRRVTLPMIAPSIGAGIVLAWARALGEFGATVTFAGNIAGRTQTLPLDVYLQLESDRGTAIALSILLVSIAAAALVLLRDRWFMRA